MSADLGFSEAVYGFGAGIFFIGYGLARIVGELFREPDANLSYLIGGTTMHVRLAGGHHTILDGIAGGVFPCAVEPPRLFSFRGRTYADPDDRGTRDRYREWLRKQEAPEVRAYVGLTPGALDGMDDGMDGMVDA